MKAFVLVNVRAGKNSVVLAALRRIDAVEMVHACWGRPDIFALVDVKNEQALSDLVMGKVQTIIGIESGDPYCHRLRRWSAPQRIYRTQDCVERCYGRFPSSPLPSGVTRDKAIYRQLRVRLSSFRLPQGLNWV